MPSKKNNRKPALISSRPKKKARSPGAKRKRRSAEIKEFQASIERAKSGAKTDEERAIISHVEELMNSAKNTPGPAVNLSDDAEVESLLEHANVEQPAPFVMIDEFSKLKEAVKSGNMALILVSALKVASCLNFSMTPEAQSKPPSITPKS